jgi:hypothetical protein
VGVGAAGLVGLFAWRWRRTRLAAARAMPPAPRSRVPAPRSGAGRSAAPRSPRSNAPPKPTSTCMAQCPRRHRRHPRPPGRVTPPAAPEDPHAFFSNPCAVPRRTARGRTTQAGRDSRGRLERPAAADAGPTRRRALRRADPHHHRRRTASSSHQLPAGCAPGQPGRAAGPGNHRLARAAGQHRQ